METTTLFLGWFVITILAVNAAVGTFIMWRRLALRLNSRLTPSSRKACVQRFLREEISIGAFATLLCRLNAKDQEVIATAILNGGDEENRRRASAALLQSGFITRRAVTLLGRRATTEALRRCPGGKNLIFVQPSLGRMRSWFGAIRAEALDQLGYLAGEYALPFAEAGLRDRSALVRNCAAMVLGRSADPAMVPVLAAHLAGANADRGPAAPAVINALSKYHWRHLDAFLQQLAVPDADVRNGVLTAMGAILLRESWSCSGEMREKVCRALDSLVAAGISSQVGATAVGVAVSAGGRAALSLVRRALRCDAVELRRAAARRSRAEWRELISDYVACLEDKDWVVRQSAARTLSSFGELGLEAMGLFLVESGDPFGCEEAAEELQRSGWLDGLLSETKRGGIQAALAMEVCGKMLLLGKKSRIHAVLGEEPAWLKSTVAPVPVGSLQAAV